MEYKTSSSISTEVETIALPDFAEDMVMVGGVIYVADDEYGLYILFSQSVKIFLPV